MPSVVTKLVTFGAFARLEGPVEGLVHVSELADRRITHPREVVLENDIIPARIVRIERDRHRLGLSLRQARTDAERAGWVFNQDGGILRMPDEVAERFSITQEPEPEPIMPEPSEQRERARDRDRADEPEQAPSAEPVRPVSAMQEAMERAGFRDQELDDGRRRRRS